MCLYAVTQEYNHTRGRVHVGYKLFEMGQVKDTLLFPYYYIILKPDEQSLGGTSKIVQRGKWMKASSQNPYYRIHSSNDYYRQYQPGFHILKSLKCAQDLQSEIGFTTVVKKVYFRNVTAKGNEKLPESHRPVQILVAQELFVPEEGQENVVPS